MVNLPFDGSSTVSCIFDALLLTVSPVIDSLFLDFQERMCHFQILTLKSLVPLFVMSVHLCPIVPEEGLSLFVGPGGSTALGSQHTRWMRLRD